MGGRVVGPAGVRGVGTGSSFGGKNIHENSLFGYFGVRLFLTCSLPSSFHFSVLSFFNMPCNMEYTV